MQVAVRCRPLSSREISRGCESIITLDTVGRNTITVRSPDGSGSVPDRTFSFDFCFAASVPQEVVYNDLGKPIVVKALEGYNGTIFAYGQTGSGKTHSMMGSSGEAAGIIPRISMDLFAQLGEMDRHVPSSHSRKNMVTVSFLEIYNEKIKDLLNPSDKLLNIRESPETGIYVDGLCELIVRDAADMLGFIEQGNAVRKVAATNMNEVSSRSHSCFTITILQKTIVTGDGTEQETLVKAKLNLVDLAGSERAAKTGAQGQTLKEGANINMSLMALGNVINALSDSKGGARKHIPYRDSKLTRLLQESLGGNAATVMVAAISPADDNYDETLSTLKYANRAKSIENKVLKNEDQQEKMISELRDQIERLKQQLSAGSGVDSAGMQETMQRLKDMEESQKNAWAEKEKLFLALEDERKRNLSSAMSSMMNDVKEQKVLKMKAIKKLTLERDSLGKAQKTLVGERDAIKTEQESLQQEFRQLQKAYDEANASDREEANKVSQDMASLLEAIEKQRERFSAIKTQLKMYKERLFEIDEELTQERAELVATSGLLEQNEQMRNKIQEEERVKAKAALDLAIEAERERLRQELGERTEVEQRHAEELSSLRSQLVQTRSELEGARQRIVSLEVETIEQKRYAESLEIRLSDAEAAKEQTQAELDEALTVIENFREQTQASVAGQGLHVDTYHSEADVNEQKFNVFCSLMDAFKKERRQTDIKIAGLQKCLRDATIDLLNTLQENSKLKQQMHELVTWEPRLLPSQVKWS